MCVQADHGVRPGRVIWCIRAETRAERRRRGPRVADNGHFQGYVRARVHVENVEQGVVGAEAYGIRKHVPSGVCEVSAKHYL